MNQHVNVRDRIEWIDNDSALRDFVSYASACDAYYLDTEFHRERTYFPRIALVQITVGDRLTIIDPLSVDIASLRRYFNPMRLPLFMPLNKISMCYRMHVELFRLDYSTHS